MDAFKEEVNALKDFVAATCSGRASQGRAFSKEEVTTEGLSEASPFEQIEAYVNSASPSKDVPRFDQLLAKIEERWPGQRCFMDADFESVAQNCVSPALQRLVAEYDVNSSDQVLPVDSTILTIDFYDPSISGAMDKRKYRILQTLELHAGQFLSAFAHCVYCQAKTKEKGWNLKDDTEFVYIADIFYCRQSSAVATQRVKALAKWVGLMSGESEEPQVLELEHVRFKDISGIAVGKPYLYCHQGGACEHVFYVTNINRLHKTQAQTHNAYPVLKYQRKLRRTKCLACRDKFARHVTCANKFSLYDPGFYCTRCLLLLTYSKSGELFQNSDQLVIQNYAHRD